MDILAQTPVGSPAHWLDGALWCRSSYSGTQGNCVEVANNLPGVVAIRDSRNPGGPRLLVSPTEWRSFIGRLKDPRLTPDA